MKKLTIFLISFACLSHQIMPAYKLVNYQAIQSLWDSIRNNNLRGIQDAIANGANLNATDNRGYTALMYAAECGHTDDTIQILINNNADVNAQDKYNNTALIRAAPLGHTDTIQILINNKADINAKNNDGMTALMYAAKNGHTKIVRILVDNNADVNFTNKIDQTPLIFAVENSHTEIVRILLNFRANPDKKNKKGKTARQINSNLIDEAILANREQAVQRLAEYSQFASNFHKDPRKYAHPAFVAQIFKNIELKTSEELARAQ